MELWTFAMRHVCNQWNATPRKDLNWLTPDEVFNGIGRRLNKRTQQFKHFHPFGCPVYGFFSTSGVLKFNKNLFGDTVY